jgi:hypothetical protein
MSALPIRRSSSSRRTLRPFLQFGQKVAPAVDTLSIQMLPRKRDGDSSLRCVGRHSRDVPLADRSEKLIHNKCVHISIGRMSERGW